MTLTLHVHVHVYSIVELLFNGHLLCPLYGSVLHREVGIALLIMLNHVCMYNCTYHCIHVHVLYMYGCYSTVVHTHTCTCTVHVHV